ncbi:unnamed protein product [Didymodactylos carnosus]|uniref:DUF642 domain-containing protein n=1 Tax=Didymodactylos carnosus TaxID=1234261 RepID=A0A815G4K9_9BILA|nr:unnamed protein product [Didymodactylos carnosus]CAF1334363.1 unnamed protein product [Didymodactylos carnosus]CAF4017273.1 unnamed protein product [Didymodactylos carnosus]CAF4190549.1 unnamed protein product [Didymodactylos carnosus]
MIMNQKPQGLCTGVLGVPVLLQTFGSSVAQYNNATPASFNFTTTYKQVNKPVTNDGMFSIVNQVHDDFGTWFTPYDHTTGNGTGDMLLVNANFLPGEVFRTTVDNLSIGLIYEFSAFLGNLNKIQYNNILPNITFTIMTPANVTVASVSTGSIPETAVFAWVKYGMSFKATTASVTLLMTTVAVGGDGDDFVADDITLAPCSAQICGSTY